MFKSPASAALVVPFLLLASGLSSQTSDPGATSPAASKIRVVRLSEIKGTVSMDRAIGRGFEAAIANMPIVENSRLKTEQGMAEVEFEDNSTLRIGPDTEVAFPQLERLASGSTASSVLVVKGTAYASLVKSQSNQFDLMFGSEKVALPPGSHVRLQADQSQAKLAVLDCSVQVNCASGPIEVSKKKTVTFAMTGSNEPMVAKNVQSEPLDSWDKDAAAYHARTASYSALRGSPYAYGMNDLSYYGNFADVGGCGMMWRPYFASAAWDPYSNGSWAFYQGAGYTWVSPYPWGWAPYHYGSWSFCPGTGWGWMPGGAWTGLGGATALIASNPSGGTIRMPAAPIHPPRVGEPTLLVVNSKPLVRSEASSADSFVFRKDSAGFGIPRNGLGKLDGFSRQSVSRGSASTPIYMSAPVQAPSNGRPAPVATAPSNMHRGYAPSASGGADARSSMGAGPRGGADAGPRGGMGAGPRGGGGGSAGPSSSSPSMSAGSASGAHTGASGSRSH